MQLEEIKDVSVDFILARLQEANPSENAANRIFKIGETQINTWKNKYKRFQFPIIDEVPLGNLNEQFKWLNDAFNKLINFFESDSSSQRWCIPCCNKKRVDEDDRKEIQAISKKWISVIGSLLDSMNSKKRKMSTSQIKHQIKESKAPQQQLTDVEPSVAQMPVVQQETVPDSKPTNVISLADVRPKSPNTVEEARLKTSVSVLTDYTMLASTKQLVTVEEPPSPTFDDEYVMNMQ